MEKENVSVLIIAGNEERNIRDCLESVRWADEIIVVDSESTDCTVEISREYTDKVLVREWDGFAEQRKFALDQASHEWVLSIDADERVSSALRAEIGDIIRKSDGVAGYFIPRQNYFLDKVITSCSWHPDYQLRLFKKKSAGIVMRKVHEGYHVDGKTSRLNSKLIHYTHQTIAGTIDKINTYSSLSAQERADGKKVGANDIFFHPLAAFLHHFLGKSGYRDGAHGLMVSLIHSTTNMLTYMKIWELQHRR